MRESMAANPYEVYCTRCRVSFPVGTKACMHCGQPIRAPGAAAALIGARSAGGDEAADELPMRTVSFSPMTLVWVLVAVGTVIYRACT
jgi:hypothetical protein